MLLGAGLVVTWYMKSKAAETLSAVADAVNPVSRENIAYTGVNSVGAVLADDPHFTLGGFIYDWTHSEDG